MFRVQLQTRFNTRMHIARNIPGSTLDLQLCRLPWQVCLPTPPNRQHVFWSSKPPDSFSTCPYCTIVYLLKLCHTTTTRLNKRQRQKHYPLDNIPNQVLSFSKTDRLKRILSSRSPSRPPMVPGCPIPARRITLPSFMAGGILITSFLSRSLW